MFCGSWNSQWSKEIFRRRFFVFWCVAFRTFLTFLFRSGINCLLTNIIVTSLLLPKSGRFSANYDFLEVEILILIILVHWNSLVSLITFFKSPRKIFSQVINWWIMFKLWRMHLLAYLCSGFTIHYVIWSILLMFH